MGFGANGLAPGVRGLSHTRQIESLGWPGAFKSTWNRSRLCLTILPSLGAPRTTDLVQGDAQRATSPPALTLDDLGGLDLAEARSGLSDTA